MTAALALTLLAAAAIWAVLLWPADRGYLGLLSGRAPRVRP